MTEPTSDRQHWYVVQVKPNSTQIAQDHLNRQGFTTFSPLYVERTREGDTRTPLFPGYLFVMFDIAGDEWRSIHSTIGVSKLLGPNGECPSPVRGTVMVELLANGGIVEDHRFEAIFGVGEHVEFIDGPLKGSVGKVLSSAKNRISLLFRVLGRDTVVYSTTSLLRSAVHNATVSAVR